MRDSALKVYNLLVSSMIATVDKLDLSIEPDTDVVRDEYDEDFDTDTLSDTQVKVSSYLVFHPNPQIPPTQSSSYPIPCTPLHP